MPSTKHIKNKIKRQNVFIKEKQNEAREKLKDRMARKKEEKADPKLKEQRLATNVPATLESMREFDETVVEGEDEEVFNEEDTDEFAQYFQGVAPKILVTTSRRATSKTYEFAEEFVTIFPTARFIKRDSKHEIKDVVKLAKEADFTDLIVINEDRKKPVSMIVVHLPDGPTCHFKLTSIKSGRDIHGHGRVTAHKPEVILNNFNTRLGHTIGRQLAAFFPQVPEFKGRQVATFHNQRDFIFFRRHRYIFKDGKRCDLQELGPRFTLKLQFLQKGTYDMKNGEYEWVHRPEMDTSRRRFFL